jgi:hypothetical protein
MTIRAMLLLWPAAVDFFDFSHFTRLLPVTCHVVIVFTLYETVLPVHRKTVNSDFREVGL